MKKRRIEVLILCLLSLNVFSEEISITLKPTKGLAGTSSVTFHEDGKVTLLVYETSTKISDNLIDIDSKAVAELTDLATKALDEYLALKQFIQLKNYTLLVGILVTQDAVTKSISSRKLTQSVITLINKLNEHIPEQYRVEIVEN